MPQILSAEANGTLFHLINQISHVLLCTVVEIVLNTHAVIRLLALHYWCEATATLTL